MRFRPIQKVTSILLAFSMLGTSPGNILAESEAPVFVQEEAQEGSFDPASGQEDLSLYAEEPQENLSVQEEGVRKRGQHRGEGSAGEAFTDVSGPDSFDPGNELEDTGLDADSYDEITTDDAIPAEAEAEEELNLTKQIIDVQMSPARLYKDSGAPTKQLKTVNELWQWMFGRDAEPDTDPSSSAVYVKVKGELPEDVTAKADYILFDEDESYPETAVASIDVSFVHADGSEYIPTAPLTVSVTGHAISDVISAGSPYFLVYAHDEYNAMDSLIVDETEFTSDVTVYRALPENDQEAQNEYWTRRAGRLAYSNNASHDRISFYEDSEGLKTSRSKGRIRFEFNGGTPLHFIISSQRPETDADININDNEADTENEDQEDPFEDPLIEGDEAIDSPAGEETEKPSENLISEEPISEELTSEEQISEELTSEEPVSESPAAEEPVPDAAGEEPVTEALPGEAFVQETDADSLIEPQTDIQTVEEPESMIPGTMEEIIETVPDTEAADTVPDTEAVETVEEVQTDTEAQTDNSLFEEQTEDLIPETQTEEELLQEEQTEETLHETEVETEAADLVTETEAADHSAGTEVIDQITETEAADHSSETEATEHTTETEAAGHNTETEAVDHLTKNETEAETESENLNEGSGIETETETASESETVITNETETESETEITDETETELETESEIESETEEELYLRSVKTRSEDGSLVSISGLMPKDVTAEAISEDAEEYSSELEGEGVLALDINLPRNLQPDEEIGSDSKSNETGEETYQPEEPVRVVISDPAIGKANQNSNGNDLEVWHIADDGTSEKVENVRFVGNSAVFYTDGFSVYVVVQTVKEQTLTASDGNTYEIKVEYDSTSGIPADAELEVTELLEGTPEYDAYVAKTAETLGKVPEDLSFAKAFDIKLTDPETGEKYQPDKDVKVSVRLMDQDVEEEEEISVVHFEKKGEEGSESDGFSVNDDQTDGFSVYEKGTFDGFSVYEIPCEVANGTVEFETDGFSVYVLTGVYYMTFKFYIHDGSTWVQYGTEQRIKNGEKPWIPVPPSGDTQEFAGWYRSKETPGGSTISQNWYDADGDGTVDDKELTDVPYDFDNIPAFTHSDVVNLYAGYGRFALVTFHDQYNGETEQWPVAFTRRVELKLKTDSVTGMPVFDDKGNEIFEGKVQIDDIETTYSGSENLACYGWSSTPVETPGVYKNPSTGAPYTISSSDGFYTVAGDTELYPVYRVFHRLSFYTAQSGQNAEYVPTQTKFEDEGFGENGKLPTTSRPGYTFQGWYIGTMSTMTEDGHTVEKVLYGSKVTDESGSLTQTSGIPYLVTPVAGVSCTAGKLYLAADTTLYAKWEKAAPEATKYQLVFWKQSTPGSDSYLYHTTVTLPAEGTEVSFDPNAALPDSVDLSGYPYSRDDGPKTISDSGTTTLTVYYKLSDDFKPVENYTITFADSMDGSAMTSPSPVSIPYNASVKTALSTYNTTPEDKKSDRGYVIYRFGGWYMDRACTIPANLDTMTMPACNVTVYAQWRAEWFIVNIDPNYGAMYVQKDDGSLEGTGSTWFWQTWDSELIGEYIHVTRDYVQSSGGNYYYVDRSRAYYGYSGNEWDNSEPDRQTFYTDNPGVAGAGNETFEYAPGAYSYVGWYEVYPDGSEAAEPYDFSHHTDHHLTLRLRWKRSGEFYLAFNAGATDI